LQGRATGQAAGGKPTRIQTNQMLPSLAMRVQFSLASKYVLLQSYCVLES
jgi:hypothetical protein